MRQEDIKHLYDKGLDDTLLITKYIQKKQTQENILDLLNDIYVSYERIKDLIDDYYQMNKEKRIVRKSVLDQYHKSLLVSSLGLCGAYLIGADPKLDFVIYTLNITAIGGFTLCKANHDDMPGYTLERKDRIVLKKDFESEQKIIVDLLNEYLNEIACYFPYFNLDKRTFIDELKVIVNSNKNYIDYKIDNEEYSHSFNYENIYKMHRELFDGVKPFNDLVEEIKASYDENDNENHKIRKKARIKAYKSKK